MATAKIVLLKKKLSDDNYPIAIRLSMKQHSTTYLRIDGYSCYSNEWNSNLCRFKRNKPSYKELNHVLNSIETKIDLISANLTAQNIFSYRKFKDRYYDNKANDNVINAFDKKIDELKLLGKTGTANTYRDSKNALLSFTKSKNIIFDDIDFKFLTDFRNQRLKTGNKINTISVYFRGLRAIHYNYCKTNNIQRPNAWLEIGIKTEATRKQALTKEQLQKLIDYKCKSYAEQRSIDIFMFSFYCRGINIMDIAQLKHTSIINNRIEYQRSKTHGKFSILITPEIQNILDKYQPLNNEYLFPILRGGDEIKERVVNFNRTQNKILKRLAEKLNIPHFSGYAARHSFASILRENNVSIDLISQSLGHSDTKVTQVYLNSFPDAAIDTVSTNLL